MTRRQRDEHHAAATCQDPISSSAPIFAPLEQILTSGGDTRLHLDPATMLNGYGCRPFPRPEAYTFASSTATSISDRAYQTAGAMHQILMDAAAMNRLQHVFDHEIERLRARLTALLGLHDAGHALVFSPSGTDSELHAVFVALTTLGLPLVSVIAASDETGSGTSFAAIGRHFSSVTSRGARVVMGDPVEGMAEHVTSVSVPLRAPDGALRPMLEIDHDVTQAVSTSIASRKHVLLHAMDHSKLGWHCPSLDCVRKIATRWQGEVQVVIDACQMRISRKRLRRYLDDGYVVQVTGSKFFTGPPFSGALFVPAPLAMVMAKVTTVPAGLSDYTCRSDWPAEWAGVKKHLGEGMNIGQFLRWVAAAEEMDRYFNVPEHYRRSALAQFTAIVPRLIEGHANLELLPDCGGDMWNRADNEELAVRTIFPFLMRRDGKLMLVEECKTVYRALNLDLGPLLPATATPAERALGGQLCHIGQPVAVRQPSGVIAGALRISAGARVVSETWSRDGADSALKMLAGEVAQVRAILDKIQLILRHFNRLHDIFRE